MFLFDIFSDPAAIVALLTLIVMEIVLGIDNLIFVSILSNKLQVEQRKAGRLIGISAAMILRLLLLSLVAIIVSLTTPLFEILGKGFSWRDLIMLAGGLFLVWKATTEIHHHMQGREEEADTATPKTVSFSSVIVQILLLDVVFSIDSIITAVGMTDEITIMVIAVIVSVGVMLVAANPLSEFISKNPTVVMLALGFLMMIGMTLLAEGFGFHVPKGYIYAAMAFSASVESLNLIARKLRKKKTS